MRVSVFGLGYVGCVSAACFAEDGHEVVGVDANPDKVKLIAEGRSPIVEPGLEELLRKGVESGSLRTTTSAAEAIEATELSLVCVGTPGQASGRLDVSAIDRVGRDIGEALKGGTTPHVAVLRSTVIPGTTEGVFRPAITEASGRGPDDGVDVAVNPEFLREATALADFHDPPLTLAGAADPATAERLRDLYRSVSAPFVATDLPTAEMAKYVANSFHALKVAFANEIGDVCESFGADPQRVMEVFRMDRKLNVSDAYLKPGFAFGGSCLPKDVRALVYAARSSDVETPLLASILPSNDGQVQRGVEAVLASGRKKVGLVGLAFKTGTDDLRESPMVRLVEALIGKGLDVRILDGSVSLARLVGANRRYIEEEIPHISSLMCERVEDLVEHAELVVLANGGGEARRVLEAIGDDHQVVDLTRGLARA